MPGQGFESVIPPGAEGRHARVADGKPSLQFVMAGTMQQIGESDGGGRPGCLQGYKSSRTVYDIIRKKDLFSATGEHVAGGTVVESASDHYCREQLHIALIPESVRSGSLFRGSYRS